jgi:hypothetical protein
LVDGIEVNIHLDIGLNQVRDLRRFVYGSFLPEEKIWTTFKIYLKNSFEKKCEVYFSTPYWTAPQGLSAVMR